MAGEEEDRFEKPQKISLAGKVLGEGFTIAGKELSKDWYKLGSDEVEVAVQRLTEIQSKLNEMIEGVHSTDLKQKLQPGINALNTKMKELQQAKTKGQIDLLMQTTHGVTGLIAEMMNNIWVTVYDLLIVHLGPEKEMNIEKAKKKADTFVTIMGDITFISGILDILGSIKILGTQLPFSAVARMIRNLSWVFGLGWISWLTLSPTVQYGIVAWYDRWYKNYVRPEQPTRSIIQKMYQRDLIDQERFMKEMGQLGNPDWLSEWYRIETIKQLSVEQLIELRQRGLIDDEKLSSYLRSLGYHTPDRELLMALKFKLATETTVKEAFKRRLISEEEYSRLLQRYGYDGEDLTLIKTTTYDLISKGILDELLHHGHIDEGEYIKRVKQLGYSDDDAELMLKSAYKPPAKETIRQLMERGLMVEEEARQWLKKFGYGSEALELETRALTYGVEQSEMTSLLSQAETEYGYGYISEDELINIYRFAGLPDNIVQIRLWRARLRLLDSINDELRNYYITLFRNDKIDEAGLRDRLSGIIKSPELIEAIIDYEVAKKEKKTEVTETLKAKDKLMKLKLKYDSLNRQLHYLITVRSEEEKYYTAKIEILEAKMAGATPEKRAILEKQVEQTEAKMKERLAYLDSKIDQVKNSIAAVEIDIEAAKRAIAS